MQFKEFINHEKVLRTLDHLGFEKATPIQAKAIPCLLQGGDLRASAQTGTGKSAAFLLPALIKLSANSLRKGPGVLVLAPTRELVIQLLAEAKRLAGSLNLTIISLYGGVPYPKQTQELRKKHDMIIATPGRLMDHMEKRHVKLQDIEMFILDEADRMLDMGFIGPVKQIAQQLPPSKQTVMFTATFGKSVRKLSEELLMKPEEITIEKSYEDKSHIQEEFIQTKSLADKQIELEKILALDSLNQAIVFSSTKMQTRKIADQLRDQGLQSGALHGDLNQRQRTKTIRQFREGKLKILVATDVAGRGIDVSTVTHVINFDAPQTVDDYIHRIGRTGRAGSQGTAFSFFSGRDSAIRREIEKLSHKKSSESSSEEETSLPFQGKRSLGRGRKDSFTRGRREEKNSRSFHQPKRKNFVSSEESQKGHYSEGKRFSSFKASGNKKKEFSEFGSKPFSQKKSEGFYSGPKPKKAPRRFKSS